MAVDAQRTICVDLDGCLADNAGGWQGPRQIGLPLPGALEGIRDLVAAGFRVVVLSCRTSTDDREHWAPGMTVEDSAALIGRWLEEHGFPECVEIWTGGGKPVASYYLDDHGLRVAPREYALAWPSAVDRIRGELPW